MREGAISDAEMIFRPMQTRTQAPPGCQRTLVNLRSFPSTNFKVLRSRRFKAAVPITFHSSLDIQTWGLFASNRGVRLGIHQQGDNKTVETCR
jgi:hypothetical protein